MAISFKDKIAYVNKFADKSDDKLQKVIKLSVNIESPKLNLTDAQKDKIKSSLETAFQRIKKIEDEKTVSGKGSRKPNLNAVAKQIKQKQGISFEEARTKAKQAFAAKKKGQTNAIQSILQDFKKKVGKIEYSRATTYVSNGVTRSTDIKRDMERPALKSGKRKVTTQGSTTNAYGTFKNKVGKVYYESRANRMDVNQPSKKRYPKLVKGGMTQKEQQKLWWLNAPKKVQEDGVEYWSNRKRMWNNKEISLTKKEIAELVEVQKIIHENLPEYDHKFHSKYADGGSVTSIMTMPKNMVEEIRKSAKMGYNIVQVGMISPKKKGVVLMNEDYQVRGTYPLEYKEFVEQIVEGKYGDGGSIAEGNYEMVLSKAKELHHHASELQDALKKEKNIEGWVVAKVERASADLSDVTHYLDGKSEYADGGMFDEKEMSAARKSTNKLNF